MNTSLNGMARLPELGVIRAQGEEAAKFLHAQLTQDFALLGMQEARLAAFCSAKGRMLASFMGFKRSETEILLICSRDLLPATLKRLSMFVLRAKLRLDDASEAFVLRGLAGEPLTSLAGAAAAPWSRRAAAGGDLIYLYPADGVPRALWIAAAGTELPPVDDVLSTEAWQLAEVRAGVATLGAPLSEAFVPQMLNYESVGGVNFKKGCYPGQEVVARSQFRGQLKRRALLAHAGVAMAPGDEIYGDADPTQPCGTVVQAAATPAGGSEAIVSGQLAALEAGGLHLRAADGPAVDVRPMPYPLRADI